MKVTTAVFPVAGLGTRFLPATKASPKEMLPIVDRPLIQYVVDEAIQAGIKKLVFVTSSSKRAIENYFDSNIELEMLLEKKEKYDTLREVRNLLPSDVKVIYVRQPIPKGLGDAVLCAKAAVCDQPFAVLLADDILSLSHRACLQDMIAQFEKTKTSVIAVEKIPQKDTNKYGIISVKDPTAHFMKIESIVEKPSPESAPSNLAVTGRYVLTPRIFEMLENTESGVGGELQLTDGLSRLLQYESLFACLLKGIRYDCGSHIGFLKATIDFALKRADTRDALRTYLQEIVREEIIS